MKLSNYGKKIKHLIQKYDPPSKNREWDLVHKRIDKKANMFAPRQGGNSNEDWPEGSEEDY